MQTVLRLFAVFFALLPLTAPIRLPAQAPAANCKTMDVQVFAGYLSLTPDYSYRKNTGIAFGLDITRHVHLPIQPSLEARANLANGPAVTQRTYLVGVRAQGTLRRVFHPYADFLIGTGTILYNVSTGTPGYRSDNSIVKSIGGGAGIDLPRHFQLKADFQQQFWVLDSHNTLAPTAILLGLSYTIPFHQLTHLLN